MITQRPQTRTPTTGFVRIHSHDPPSDHSKTPDKHIHHPECEDSLTQRVPPNNRHGLRLQQQGCARQMRTNTEKPDDAEKQNARDQEASCVGNAATGPGLLRTEGRGSAFHSRNRFGFPHLDSNQDKGFQRPVCCHYTMGDRRLATAKLQLCHTLPFRQFNRALHCATKPVKPTKPQNIKRTGSPARDAPDRCRTVRRPNHPRTPP